MKKWLSHEPQPMADMGLFLDHELAAVASLSCYLMDPLANALGFFRLSANRVGETCHVFIGDKDTDPKCPKALVFGLWGEKQ